MFAFMFKIIIVNLSFPSKLLDSLKEEISIKESSVVEAQKQKFSCWGTRSNCSWKSEITNSYFHKKKIILAGKHVQMPKGVRQSLSSTMTWIKKRKGAGR